MDERKRNYIDWDDSVYGTGPTEPPKSRGGLLALLLILVIFLCGIVTVLGVLNVKLFQKLQLREEQDLAIYFAQAQAQTDPTEALLPTQASQDAQSSPGAIRIQQAPQSPDNRPQQEGLSLQDIYAQNIPAVASITCSQNGGTSTGTAVVFDPEGLLVTNAHVVDGAVSITVQLTDDRIFPASVLGRDEISDLAVLRIDCTDLTPAQFGDSDALRVGDTVVAIGDPLGVKFRGTYTDGIVSAINRDVEVGGHTMTLIQTNAALNAGNSGGPLINAFGQVVGINTMKIGAFTDNAGVEGLGFAIPSATVRDIVDQLIAQGYVSGRPTLGITGEALSIFYQHYYRLPSGLYITGVDRDSDAHVKGIQNGDILTQLGEQKVTTMNEVKAAIGDRQVGETVKAVIYRSGQAYEVELTLTEDKG